MIDMSHRNNQAVHCRNFMEFEEVTGVWIVRRCTVVRRVSVVALEESPDYDRVLVWNVGCYLQ